MSDLRAAVTDALGPLYRVEREVRPVGEDRLFVVNQIPTGPQLLVKVLPAAVSLAIDAQRFERDLLLLAERLHHANLIAPKGGGRAGAFIYHARPFIAGTTLHAWMARSGAVPLARAVAILRSVLGGLVHAHAGGIAHGALRAECVLLGEDGIALADAGIAGVLGRTSSRAGDMAVLSGVVHEMLVGRPPRIPEEPLDRSRTLPPWLTEWLQTHWDNAADALAALRPN